MLSFRACRETWGGFKHKDTESDDLLKKFKNPHTPFSIRSAALHTRNDNPCVQFQNIIIVALAVENYFNLSII